MKSNDCIDIQIKESNLELLSMIQKENDPILRKRLLALQIFVSGVAKSYLSIARTLGISPNSVSTWFRLYEKAGIKAVLSRRKTGPVVGSSTVLKPSTIETVMKRLADPEVGFQSFVELQNFISELEGTEVKYYTIYRFFRKGKGAKLKVVRPSNVKKNENLALVIKKKIRLLALLILKRESEALTNFKKVDFLTMDEMRLGLKTDLGKKVTLRGVKPVGKHQHVFSYQYLSGAISLCSGESWIYQQDCCNGLFFQGFLNELSDSNSDVLHIIILDNGSFHKNKSLIIPKNIRLIFLPAYSPEFNPIERFWQEVRRFLKNKVFETLDDLMKNALKYINDCSSQFCRSVVGYKTYDNVLELLNSINN